MDIINIDTTSIYIVAIDDYPGENRRARETAAVTSIITAVLGRNALLTHDADGAPLVSGGNISISHSRKYAVVALDRKQPIGIDVEEWRPALTNIKSKFLSHYETDVFITEEQLLTAWTIKEAVYKVAGKKAVEFSSAITIDTDMNRAYALGASYRITSFILDTSIHDTSIVSLAKVIDVK